MSYVTTIHGQFTNRRKISILKKARVILKKDLLITMEVSSVNYLFQNTL